MQNMTAFNIEEDDPANNAIKRTASRERRRSRVASWQHVGVGRGLHVHHAISPTPTWGRSIATSAISPVDRSKDNNWSSSVSVLLLVGQPATSQR